MLSKQYQLFHNPAFRRLTISCALAMFGNGLTYIIMVWALMHIDASIASTAILMTCFWLPNVVFGPFMGVWVDRCNRKTILLLTNGSRCVLLVGFALIAYRNQITPLAIYCLASLIGTILAAYIPAAMTFVRELVAEEDLLYANALLDTAYEIGAVLGMGGAGLILASSSFAICYLINAFCYLLATVLIMGISFKPKCNQGKIQDSFFQEFIQGGRYIWARTPILLIYLVQGLFFISYMTAPVLLAPYAKLVLHSSVLQFGWLEAMLSMGIIIGGFINPWLASRFGVYKVILAQIMIGVMGFYLFSHTLNVNLAIFYHLLLGFSFSSWALLTTAAQEMTDINYQGRVQSLFNSLSGAVIILFYYLFVQWKDIPMNRFYWGEIGLLALSSLFLLLMVLNKPSASQEQVGI